MPIDMISNRSILSLMITNTPQMKPKRIDPAVLKKLLKDKGLSLADLAKRAKINKQTIWRLTADKVAKARNHTIEQIAHVLKVDSQVLTGEVSVPEGSLDSEPVTSKNKLNVRIGTAQRNGLNLVAGRYRVAPSEIVELAPYLFVWAAEESLRRRQERLSQLVQVLDQTKTLGRELRHLSPQLNIFLYADDAIAAEQSSINERDLFGSSITLDLAGVAPDFDADDENPFAMFLRELGSSFSAVATFEGWSGSPRYRVCPEEAAELVGGESDRADEILRGDVALNEIPKEIRKHGMEKERAEWVRAKAEEYRRVLADDLAELERLFESKEVSK